MLGYDLKDGAMTINPEGAELVRLIFRKYGVERKGTRIVARELREAGYKTLTGNTRWNNSQIMFSPAKFAAACAERPLWQERNGTRTAPSIRNGAALPPPTRAQATSIPWVIPWAVTLA
ncbi:MAG: recombinase family protein [Oscillospiraceae bacterium]|nr:recombinase family protein [Oscillospiraceae bacterium]